MITTIGTTRLARPVAIRWSWVAAAVGVAGQIGFVLTAGAIRNGLAVASIAAFCLALAGAAATPDRLRGGLAVGAALAAGLAVEVIGLRSGVPFGRYVYGSGLGPGVLGVPGVVPLAWAAMGLAALAVGRTLAATPVAVALVGGAALASWDLFLDPQMVGAGHWRWLDPHPALPGVPGVPLSNYAGWLVVAIALIGVLDRLLPAAADLGSVAAAVYLWTYGSQVAANLTFFDRPAVALVGGLGMGAVAVPYVLRLGQR